jgi:hypothetical protein
MNEFKREICENCHERPATQFICYGGTGKSTHLCDECFANSAPADIRQLATATKEACCQYCGGQPCGCETDFLALVTGVQKLKFMCLRCSMEHNRYVQQLTSQWNAAELSQEEQLTLIRKLDEDVDKHMKQWVSEESSR